MNKHEVSTSEKIHRLLAVFLSNLHLVFFLNIALWFEKVKKGKTKKKILSLTLMNAWPFVARGKKRVEEDLPYINLEPHILTGNTTSGAENEPAVGQPIGLFSKEGNLRENSLGLLSTDQDCSANSPSTSQNLGIRDSTAPHPTSTN